jgi:hypothetical protein
VASASKRSTLGDDHIRAERLAKLPDVDPHRLGAGRRRLARPELLGEGLDRDGLAATQEQQGEQRAQLRSAQQDVLVGPLHAERTEEREPHP